MTASPSPPAARSAYPGLLLEKRGLAAIVTLDNPPAHTWTEDSLAGLAHLVRDLEADPAIRALIITGSGEKFFSAGADLRRFAPASADADMATAAVMARRFGEAFETLSAYSGVSIAALNGYAMGGGLECALACDLRIAEAHAVMALPEAAVGLLPCAGGTQWLTRQVGESWAKRMVLLGERVDADLALRIGLVDETVPRGQALSCALALAEQVGRQSPGAVRACKRLIQGARHVPAQQMLMAEREAFLDLVDTADRREGVRAFLEKRAPQWVNR